MNSSHSQGAPGSCVRLQGSPEGGRRRRSLLFAGVGLAALVVSVLSTVAPALAASTTAASTTASSSDPTGNVFVPLSQPVRICDTRPTSESTVSDACTGHTLSAGGSITVDMPSAFVPPTATAAVLGVAVTNTAGQGFITVWPSNESMPTVSNLDYTKGQTISNTVTVGLGTAGAVSLYNGPPTGTGGSADVIVDLEGYYGPSITTTNAGEFTALSPARIADTRCGRSPNGPGSDCSAEAIPSANDSLSLLSPGNSINVAVAGLGGVPAASDVSGVVLNVTTTNASGPGYISAYPTGSANPATAPTPFSNQQFTFDSTISTKVVVGLGTNGDVSIYDGPARGGSYVDVVVDVDGYFSSPNGPAGSLFTPTTPVRLLDNRVTGTPLAPGSSEQLPIAGANGVPAGSAGAVLNVTDVATKGNFLTVYPDDGSLPTTSDVNYSTFDPYDVLPNAAYAKLGADGGIKIYNGPADTKNNAASAFVVVDLFGYFTPPTSTTSVTVAASPASLPANGTSTSTVTVTVTKNGSALPGDAVFLVVSPGSPACGSITSTPNPNTTNSSGVATFTYTAGSSATTCTLTALEDDTGATGTAAITQTALNTVKASFGPVTVPAGGTTTSTLAVNVTNASGAAVGSDALTITLTPSVAGSCGTLSPATGLSTNSSGDATTTYTPSSTSGFCQANITEGQTGATGTAVLIQSPSTAPTNTPYAVTVTASPSSVAANGNSHSTVTVHVVDSTNTAVDNDPVFVFGTPSAPGACGTFTTPFGSTNASGNATFTYTSSTTAGTCTITAIEAADQKSGTAPITQGALSIAVTASPSTLPADGKSTSAITVTVGGAGATGDAITLTATPTSTDGACGSLSASSGSTSGGTFSTTYTAASSQGFCVISATEADTGQSANTDITQKLSTASGLTITASPTTIAANPSATSTVTVTVTSASGTPIAGDTVTFSEQGTPNGVCSSSNLGNISGTPAGTTNTAGQVTATYTASTTGGTCAITATENQNGHSGTVTITQSTANTLVLTASPSSVPEGSTTTSTLTATVTSVSGAPVSGDTVNMVEAASYPTGACGTFSNPSSGSGTTTGSGVFTVTYTPSNTVGFCFIGATETQSGKTAGVVIDQTLNPVPSPKYSVTVSPSPTGVPADGKSTSTVTVTVMNGPTGVGSDPVVLTTSPSATGACGTLSSTEITTGVSGSATLTYTASTTPGTCTLTATEAASGASSGGSIVQAPPANTVTLGASATTVLLNTPVTITATVTNSAGQPVVGDTVDFAIPANGCLLVLPTCALSASSGVTNSSGQASTQLSGLGLLGSATVTATDTGPSAGGSVPPQTTNPSASVTITVVASL